MRVYIVLLALSVFVVAVSAEEQKPEDVIKSIKKGMECIYKFFYEDPLGKRILQLAKDWKESMLEARGKVRASLAEYIKTLKSEAD
uniref:8 kDa glycoprotein n=1 Tax=Taenia hydatigena TaxID=85431 RepID=B6E4C4_TAEHY|nr:8 kDa glycoprotein [Taenia hydatigena]